MKDAAAAPATGSTTTSSASQAGNSTATTGATQSTATATAAPAKAATNGTPAPETAAPTKTTPEPDAFTFEHTLKIDGQEVPVRYQSKEELARDLQLARASQKRMQEAAALRREFEAWAQQVQQSPLQALQSMGPEVMRALETEIAQEIARREQLQGMTPEQRQVLEVQQQAEAYRRQLEEMQQQQQQQAKQAYEAQLWSQWEPQLKAELEKLEVPADPLIYAELATIGAEWAAAGNPLEPAQVVALLARKHEGVFSSRWAKIKTQPEKVAQLLGEDGWRALSEYKLSQWRQQTQKPVGEPPPQKATEAEHRSISEAEFMRRFRGG